MANIVPVTPKQEVEKYRNVTITYAFDPHTSLWGYKYTYIQEHKFTGAAKGLAKAKKEAHKQIDDMRGP